MAMNVTDLFLASLFQCARMVHSGFSRGRLPLDVVSHHTRKRLADQDVLVLEGDIVQWNSVM